MCGNEHTTKRDGIPPVRSGQWRDGQPNSIFPNLILVLHTSSRIVQEEDSALRLAPFVDRDSPGWHFL